MFQWLFVNLVFWSLFFYSPFLSKSSVLWGVLHNLLIDCLSEVHNFELNYGPKWAILFSITIHLQSEPYSQSALFRLDTIAFFLSKMPLNIRIVLEDLLILSIPGCPNTAKSTTQYWPYICTSLNTIQISTYIRNDMWDIVY